MRLAAPDGLSQRDSGNGPESSAGGDIAGLKSGQRASIPVDGAIPSESLPNSLLAVMDKWRAYISDLNARQAESERAHDPVHAKMLEHRRAVYALCLAELETLRAAGEIATIALSWYPIETAPKDGSRLLAWNGTRRAIIWFAAYSDGSSGWHRQNILGETLAPWDLDPDTHWMPLPPAPPQAPEQE